MTSPGLLTLPGELRNAIYEQIHSDLEITIRDGKILTPAFAQTCLQLRAEFLSFLQPSEHNLKPSRTTIQVRNFDFDETVEFLERSCDATESTFDVQVKVSKPLGRTEWEKIWSWVHFCDSLSVIKGNVTASKVNSSYAVSAKLQACNPYAACHALYVEVIPYILKGGAGRRQTSAGYEQIEKMRAALAGCSSK